VSPSGHPDGRSGGSERKVGAEGRSVLFNAEYLLGMPTTRSSHSGNGRQLFSDGKNI
jgi:hypothetical protein